MTSNTTLPMPKTARNMPAPLVRDEPTNPENVNTCEGTLDVHALITERGITGLQVFS